MAKRGTGFGTILLLIVVAVVLVLAAKSWTSVAPAALDTDNALNSGPISDNGQPEASQALREGRLPNVTQMQAETDQHSDHLQEALDTIE